MIIILVIDKKSKPPYKFITYFQISTFYIIKKYELVITYPQDENKDFQDSKIAWVSAKLKMGSKNSIILDLIQFKNILLNPFNSDTSNTLPLYRWLQ